MGCEAPRPAEFSADFDRLADVHRIAVLGFSDGPGQDGVNSGAAVSAMAIDRLARAKRFRMCEREKLSRVLAEMDLKAAAITDDATAAKVGKMLGADAVLVGSVTQYDMDKTQLYIYIIPIVTRTFTVGVACRLVGVADGAVIYTCAAEGRHNGGFTEASRHALDLTLDALVKPPKSSVKKPNR